MMRNKEIAIACEEFGFKRFALCYLDFLISVSSHPYASQLGTVALVMPRGYALMWILQFI